MITICVTKLWWEAYLACLSATAGTKGVSQNDIALDAMNQANEAVQDFVGRFPGVAIDENFVPLKFEE